MNDGFTHDFENKICEYKPFIELNSNPLFVNFNNNSSQTCNDNQIIKSYEECKEFSNGEVTTINDNTKLSGCFYDKITSKYYFNENINKNITTDLNAYHVCKIIDHKFKEINYSSSNNINQNLIFEINNNKTNINDYDFLDKDQCKNYSQNNGMTFKEEKNSNKPFGCFKNNSEIIYNSNNNNNNCDNTNICLVKKKLNVLECQEYALQNNKTWEGQTFYNNLKDGCIKNNNNIFYNNKNLLENNELYFSNSFYTTEAKIKDNQGNLKKINITPDKCREDCKNYKYYSYSKETNDENSFNQMLFKDGSEKDSNVFYGIIKIPDHNVKDYNVSIKLLTAQEDSILYEIKAYDLSLTNNEKKKIRI